MRGKFVGSRGIFRCVDVKKRIYAYRRKLKLNTPLAAIHGDTMASQGRPDHTLNYKEAAENIEKLIRLLPERMQLIFRMNREDELSYQEIADLLEISINSVKTQMYRAIKFLKETYRFDSSVV